MQATTNSTPGVSCPSWCTNHDADDDGGIFHETSFGAGDTKVTVATSPHGIELLLPEPAFGSIREHEIETLMTNMTKAARLLGYRTTPFDAGLRDTMQGGLGD